MKVYLNVLILLMLGTISMQAQKKSKSYYLADAKTPQAIEGLKNKMDRVMNMFIGHFSNKKMFDETQTVSDNFVEQEFIGRQIWKKRGGEMWVYLGWFKADYIENPMAQSVCRFSRVAPDTMLLEYFNIPNPEKYAKEWMEKDPFKGLKPDDLISLGEGCGTYITHKGDNVFQLSPTDIQCHNPLNAAIEYFTIGGEASTEGLNFDTRFYDKTHNLVLQYPDGNQFMRLDKSKPKYSSK